MGEWRRNCRTLLKTGYLRKWRNDFFIAMQTTAIFIATQPQHKLNFILRIVSSFFYYNFERERDRENVYICIIFSYHEYSKNVNQVSP